MGERFKYFKKSQMIVDRLTDERYLGHDRICELLNDLNDENEQLKSRVEYLERKIQRERRTSTKQHLKWSKEAEEQIQILAEEKEHLKHELKTIKNILFDLKEIKGYWDSSILQNVIDNIAEQLGVDLDD